MLPDPMKTAAALLLYVLAGLILLAWLLLSLTTGIVVACLALLLAGPAVYVLTEAADKLSKN